MWAKFSVVFLLMSVMIQMSYSESLSAFIGKKILRLNDVKDNTGVECVVCTAALALVEQMAQVHEKPVEEAMEMLCSYLPNEFGQYCVSLIETYGDVVIKMFEQLESPDRICHQIEICSDPTCKLFIDRGNNFPLPSNVYPRPKLQRLKESPIDWIIAQVMKVFDSHLPLVDIDSDKFGISEELRGSSWRGLDCNDFDANTYPGRKDNHYQSDIDYNCNGIHGTNPTTKKKYKDELCNVTQYGVAILGDSAGAHFHIPGDWFQAALINENTFKDLIEILTNELDWPQMSAVTGYMYSPWVGHPEGNVSSTYLKILERNRCIHRDYQNIAVNGARSGAMSDKIVFSLARNQKLDHPMFVTLALIGNDVCNGHPDMDHMTTPQEMYTNTLTTLQYLDTVLPANSYVFIGGLANGTMLYDLMHDRLHPIGILNQDATYSTFYDFMNCNGISPCFGWMNTNATWRARTQERADQLNVALQDLVKKEKFKNFRTFYFDENFNEILDIWVKQGGKPWDLIEPVDGFHPSQIATFLAADFQWSNIVKQYPDILPPINPNNDKIKQLFGDQNGY
jgi:acyloxyacyl hydrolase